MPADVSTGPTSNMRRRRGEARTYDFRRPVRLAREHAHLLRVAMQTFGRQSTTVLTTSLRAVCQIGAPQIEELSYDEFLSSMKVLIVMFLVVQRFTSLSVSRMVTASPGGEAATPISMRPPVWASSAGAWRSGWRVSRTWRSGRC